jgi:hypothetical protein
MAFAFPALRVLEEEVVVAFAPETGGAPDFFRREDGARL